MEEDGILQDGEEEEAIGVTFIPEDGTMVAMEVDGETDGIGEQNNDHSYNIYYQLLNNFTSLFYF
jgi:hypothetical protein